MIPAKKRTTADIHRAIADKVIEAMETSGKNWAKHWAVPASEQPVSMSTGKAYRGINWLLLGIARSEHRYQSGRWATYKQWKGLGAQVRAGEKGEMVILYKPILIDEKKDGKKTGEKVNVRLIRAFTVFNADQVDGYAIPKNDDGFEWAEMPATVADDLAERAGAVVGHNDKSSAFYIPSQDRINMPEQCQFDAAEGYAATLLHELTHWSGHETRCDRKLKNSFGTKDYAKEELVAELGAAMMCGSLGISPEPREDHAKYLNGWIERLKDDPKVILSAAAKANQAAEWIFDAAEVQQSEVKEAA